MLKIYHQIPVIKEKTNQNSSLFLVIINYQDKHWIIQSIPLQSPAISNQLVQVVSRRKH